MVRVDDLRFGACVLHQDRRELTLLSLADGKTVAEIAYDAGEKAAKGSIWDCFFSLSAKADAFPVQIGRFSFVGSFGGRGGWRRLRLSATGGGRIVDLYFSRDLSSHCTRLAYLKKDGKRYVLNVSRNRTLPGILKGALSVFSFGLCKPALEGILPDKDAPLSEEEHAACLSGAIALQLVFCPFDYHDWS